MDMKLLFRHVFMRSLEYSGKRRRPTR